MQFDILVTENCHPPELLESFVYPFDGFAIFVNALIKYIKHLWFAFYGNSGVTV